ARPTKPVSGLKTPVAIHTRSECWTAFKRTAGRRAAAASAAPRSADAAMRSTSAPPWGRIRSADVMGSCDSQERKAGKDREDAKVARLCAAFAFATFASFAFFEV